MIELNVTNIVCTFNPRRYAASILEAGPNAGPDTWQAAIDDGPGLLKLSREELREVYRLALEIMDGEDPRKWTVRQCKAFLLQYIALEWRECFWCNGVPDDGAWAEYQKRADDGVSPSSFFRTESGEIYFNF